MIKYRREIDGLRALAVVAVILFHAGLDTFSGGFIGVDIFFVISGYLISSIILTEYKKNCFNFKNFYERRARRILPALFCVIFVTIPFAWAWMMPTDLKEFGDSIAAVSIFASNFFFWKKTGYFQGPAEMKPMLHTWSLAVEEQFYLFFPIFLIALLWFFKKRPTWVLCVLFAGSLASLSIADWGSRHHPEAAFYLLPTRGWELMIGIIIAFATQYYPKKVSLLTGNRTVSEASSFLGLNMIILSVILYTAETPFPGVYAFLPTIGAGLIILFSSPGTFTGQLLGSKPFVGIGLISYSAYLWHQPLFTLVRHRNLSDPEPALLLFLATLSFILAALSWHFVEQPFRKKGLIATKTVVLFGITGTIILIAIGLALHFTNGGENLWISTLKGNKRITYDLVSTRKDDLGSKTTFGECRFFTELVTQKEIQKYKKCREKYGHGIAVIGDSHSRDFFGAINRNLEHNFIIGTSQPGCRPHDWKDRCSYDEILKFIQQNPDVFSHVIYEQAGFYLLTNDNGDKGSRGFFSTLQLDEAVPNYRPYKENISKIINYLNKIAEHVPVIWLGTRLEPHIHAKQMFKLGCDYDFRLRPNLRNVYTNLDKNVAETVKKTAHKNINYVSQLELVPFDIEKEFMSCNVLYWRDTDHWTAQGEKYFGEPIVSELKTKLGYPE